MTITNPVELRRRGFEVLVQQLGYVDALRFMLQYEEPIPGRNYTEERRAILDHLTTDTILAMARERANHQ